VIYEIEYLFRVLFYRQNLQFRTDIVSFSDRSSMRRELVCLWGVSSGSRSGVDILCARGLLCSSAHAQFEWSLARRVIREVWVRLWLLLPAWRNRRGRRCRFAWVPLKDLSVLLRFRRLVRRLRRSIRCSRFCCSSGAWR
jgi:hypothetical protein